MLEASDIYGQEKNRQAAERAGGLILLAQMSEPHSAWTQQYDADMHPGWARPGGSQACESGMTFSCTNIGYAAIFFWRKMPDEIQSWLRGNCARLATFTPVDSTTAIRI